MDSARLRDRRLCNILLPRNRWTSPQLDDYAARWREDGDLKAAVSRLKFKFMSSAEAMIHG